MPEYYVYILRCEDESLYTGITVDVSRRIQEHQSQKPPAAKYTQTHKVIELVALWKAPNRSVASKCEYHIKQLPRNEKDRLVFYPERIASLFEGAEQLVAIPEAELERLWSDAQ